jgi:hypothetical protein
MIAVRMARTGTTMAVPSLAPSELQHLLLTRFNIWSPFGSDNLRLSTEYLEYRFRLFERYCFPSVMSQTCRNFRWILFLDRDTPLAIKHKMVVCCAKSDRLTPVYLSYEDGVNFDARLWSFVQDHVVDDKRYLLTTRLDNDDALARHFVETIQSHVTANDVFVNLPRGYRYVEATNTLYEVVHDSNPFASRLEDCSLGTPQTVLNVDHMQMRLHGRVRQVMCDASWVIVVHRRNVSNCYDWSERRVARSGLGASFVMPAEAMQGAEKHLDIVVHNSCRRARLVIVLPLARVFQAIARRSKRVFRSLPRGECACR